MYCLSLLIFVNRCHILSGRFLVEKHPSSNTNIYSCHCRTCSIKCFDEFKLIISDKCFSTGSCRSVYSSKSFLFSLYNINGYAPVKVNIKSSHYSNAIYTCSSIGPTFGGRYDLYIHKNAASNSISQTYCGYRYSLPPGYSAYGFSCRFYAGGSSIYFTPTDIEVFYETTT